MKLGISYGLLLETFLGWTASISSPSYSSYFTLMSFSFRIFHLLCGSAGIRGSSTCELSSPLGTWHTVQEPLPGLVVTICYLLDHLRVYQLVLPVLLPQVQGGLSTQFGSTTSRPSLESTGLPNVWCCTFPRPTSIGLLTPSTVVHVSPKAEPHLGHY